MRKSIFFKLALLVIVMITVIDAAVLFVSYRITYDSQLSASTDKITRIAEVARTFYKYNYTADPDKSADVASFFYDLCDATEISYVYALDPDVDKNSMTYIAIGFGEDASIDARLERYPGITVNEALSDEIMAAVNGDDSGVIEHYNNRYGEMIACYFPVTEYYDKDKGRMAQIGHAVIVGAEENITAVVSQIQREFTFTSALTIVLTLIIVSLIFLILYFKISKPIIRISEKMKSYVSDRDKGFEKLPVKGSGELAEVSRSFNSMTDEIDSYLRNIDQLTKEKHVQQAELDISRKIQSGLLKPTGFINNDVEINAFMLAAKNVGGDLYDYIVLDDGRICLSIADVSGKGISAALFMSRALTMLHQYALLGYSPAEALSVYNDTLAEQNPGKMFITTFVAIYDPATRELKYSNAGHNLPYIISDTLIELDVIGGVAAGIFPGKTYKEASVTLKEGDVLFLYTDGVNESVDENGIFFGTEALEDELKLHIGGDGRAIVGDVLKKLKDFSGNAAQSDDITMLTMTVKHEDPEKGKNNI